MNPQNRSASARGWSVVFAALAINLILGVLYAWGVTGKALVGHWHWSKADAALPFTVSTGAFAVTMMFAGRLQDKIGPRLVATVGGLILGSGLALSYFARTPHWMMVTFGIIGGIGLGVGYSATTPPAIKWFPPARKGLITGMVVSGIGLAAVYMSPLTHKLIATYDIPRTFLIFGLGTLVLVTLLAQLLANPPAGYVPAPAAASAKGAAQSSATARRDYDWHEMLRTGQFYQLWLMFILSVSAGLMVIMHVALIAKDQAHVDWGFWLIAILALCNSAGRLVSGFLSDRIGRTNTMVLAFLLQALNMFAFRYYTTPELMVFGAAWTGVCYGTVFTLFPAITADFYGVRNLGVNYGLVFTAFGVAGAAGPYIAGRIRDTYGTYNHAYLLCASMLLVGAVLAFVTRAPKAAGASVATSSRRETATEREAVLK